MIPPVFLLLFDAELKIIHSIRFNFSTLEPFDFHSFLSRHAQRARASSKNGISNGF